MTLHAMRANSGVRWLAWILSAAMISFGGAPAAFGVEQICGPNDLADVPLELVGGSGPPPMFMIVFSNTASMDYEIMTGGGDNGRLPSGSKKNKASIAWIYRTDRNINEGAIENPDFYGAWKGMCYTHNNLAYNPYITYTPWPRWDECARAAAGAIDQPSNRQPSPPDATTNGINAHVDRPRPEPMSNTRTYDLTATFGRGFSTGDPFTVLGSFSVNQKLNNDTWMPLGGDFSFPEGIVRISVEQDVKKVNDSNPGYEFFAGPVRTASV